jgi:hypothetical protein
VSCVEIAVNKVKRLDETQARALLEWLEMRENSDALRRKLDEEIQLGIDQLKRGQRLPSGQVHAELRERSRKRRAEANG